MEPGIYKVGDLRSRNFHGHDHEAEILFEKDVPATMRDGVELMTNVFRPTGGGPVPAMIFMAPYGKDSMPPDEQFLRIRNVGVLPFSELAGWETPDPAFWVPNGYALVSIDCRATNRSGGAKFEHLSEEMGRDFFDAVEWTAAQEWCDGNVGSNGVSYLASTQWLGASTNPPHLKAIMPWEGFNDFYRDHVFHGGMPETAFFNQIWARRMNAETGFVAKGAEAERIIEEQKARPLIDDFWEGKRVKLEKIDVPAFVVAGWATQGLHVRGAMEGWRRIASKDKYLYGHGRKEWESYYNREALERQKRFFDRYLKGEENGFDEEKRVRIEIRDRFYDGRMREFDDFPAPGTEYRPLYLNAADGTMGEEKPSAEASLRYAAQQSGSDDRDEPDRAEWSYLFTEDTDLAGGMKLKLWVSAEGADDMDLHVGLKKFDRRGNEVPFADFQHIENGLVASGWLRVSHRELDAAMSTPDRPYLKHERLQKLSDGEIVAAEVEILPSATGFRAGERLVLIVQGYDIVDYIARFKHTDTVNAGTHVVHAGGAYDSHVLVPLLPG
jgi:predicted acyl esterase